jgi:uncharacterized protein YoxC
MIPYAETTAVAERRTNEQIAVEIRLFQRQTLANAIEVGRRLAELKDNFADVKDFYEYVKGEFDISRSSTYGFMRLFTEYGAKQMSLFGSEAASPLLGKLNYSQALALLAVPADEREEFVEVNHVEDISVRELQQLIMERDNEIKRLKDRSEVIAEESENVINGHKKNLESARERVKELGERVKELEARPIETVVNENTEELEAAETKIKELENSLNQVKSESGSERERLTAELTQAKREADELRNKPPVAASTVIEQFKWQFGEWQSKLNDLLNFPAKSGADEQDSAKIKKALTAALKKALEIVAD